MVSDWSSARTAAAGAAIAAVVAVSLAGCGGGAGAAATSSGAGAAGGSSAAAAAVKAPKACKLFTAKLAHSELGKKVRLSINKYENPLLSQCEYNGTTGFIAVLSGPWNEIKSEAANGKPVSGIGDQAISSAAGLVVRKGSLGISVDAAITGTFSGSAATSVEKRQLAAEKRLGKALVKSL